MGKHGVEWSGHDGVDKKRTKMTIFVVTELRERERAIRES